MLAPQTRFFSSCYDDIYATLAYQLLVKLPRALGGGAEPPRAPLTLSPGVDSIYDIHGNNYCLHHVCSVLNY